MRWVISYLSAMFRSTASEVPLKLKDRNCRPRKVSGNFFILFAVLLVACSPPVQIVDRVVERTVEVPVTQVLIQCFDGSIRGSASECPPLISGAAVQAPVSRSILDGVLQNYWFEEEDGFSVRVAGSLRRSGDVVWDTKQKKAWVFLDNIDRKWYVREGGIAPKMSDWSLPAYLELDITFDEALDRARIPQFSMSNKVWQRLQPIYRSGPRDYLERFADATPIRVETASQSLRVMKRDIASNRSLHFADGNKTVVLKLDNHYAVPFVIEEFDGFTRLSHRAFLFSEYAKDGQNSIVLSKSTVGLPDDAVILSAKEWEAYREFQDG